MTKSPSEIETKRLFKKIGAKIRAIRLSKGMVQEDFIDYGFTTRHYQRIEAGHPITVRTAYRISKIFGIKLIELFKDL